MPLWNHGCVMCTPDSMPCVTPILLMLRNFFFQVFPSARAMARASFGSSTIRPVDPVKSMATRDRTLSCNKKTIPWRFYSHWQSIRRKILIHQNKIFPYIALSIICKHHRFSISIICLWFSVLLFDNINKQMKSFSTLSTQPNSWIFCTYQNSQPCKVFEADFVRYE